MTDANIVAEPSAATFNGNDQNTWSPEQREHWNQTGKAPEPPKAAESAPADPPKEAKSEGKPKSAAEPEAAPKQEPNRKPNAEERIAELISDRKRLEERLRKLESQPAAKPETKEPVKAEPPKRPNPFTFKGTPEELDKAMDEYEAARDEYRDQKFAEKQQANVRTQQFIAKVEDARARYGQEQFDATIESASKAIAEQAAPTVKEYLQRSDLFADLLYVIGGTEKSLNDFLGSAKNDPITAIRKLAFMEIEIGKELSKGKSDDKKDDAKPEPEKKAEAPAKPEPRAPKPPSEVGGRGTAPTDEAAEAARSGDYRKFEAEQDRRMQARYAKA